MGVGMYARNVIRKSNKNKEKIDAMESESLWSPVNNATDVHRLNHLQIILRTQDVLMDYRRYAKYVEMIL